MSRDPGQLAVHPRRSVLFVPGTNARALEKARGLACDALIVDLEDAVAPTAKDAARDAACAWLDGERARAHAVCVRTNPLDTPWGQADIAAVARRPLQAVVLPKVESAATVIAASAALRAAGAADSVGLWPMIETPLGVLESRAIAAADPRVECLVMGTSDLVKDLRARQTADRLAVLGALSQCLLAARAAGVDILDGVHLDLEDDDGFAAACRQGRDLGFDGKTLIHPRQIAPANAAFGPSPDEVEQAHAVIATWERALAEGAGVAVLDGRLVEVLHVEEARRLLAVAEAIASHGD
ncbi:MAG: CoA ester lyase [Ectothiorhodospiraceae bacterium]|nr:CoA ester lyase [Ectothiorhodospiraceae bacterium]